MGKGTGQFNLICLLSRSCIITTADKSSSLKENVVSPNRSQQCEIHTSTLTPWHSPWWQQLPRQPDQSGGASPRTGRSVYRDSSARSQRWNKDADHANNDEWKRFILGGLYTLSWIICKRELVCCQNKVQNICWFWPHVSTPFVFMVFFSKVGQSFSV